LKTEILAVVIILLVAGGLGAGYFAGVSNRQTVILTGHTATYSSSVSSSGLQLELWLSTTSFSKGGGVTAQIHIVNTLAENVTVTPVYSSNSTISKWNGYDFFCGPSEAWGVIGFALFPGHYTQANISSAGNPLTLAPNVAIGCVTYPNPVSLVWLPESERTVAYYSVAPPATGRAEVNAATEYCVNEATGATVCGGNLNVSILGYWSPTMPLVGPSDATTSSKYFSFLAAGEYTLVTEDLWNQNVFGYFQVLPK
jgi:hypothetical protein